MNSLICNYILRHYKCISFDVFDTLIERDVLKPTDIFALVGEKILGKEQAEEFSKLRKKAEQRTRKDNNYEEITLNQIYMNLKDVYDQDVRDRLKNEEIKTEIEHCHTKKSIVPLYKRCVEKEKRILIISDMYLPADVIKMMLNHCNILDYEQLYVSSEYGVNKISGILFQTVLENKKIESTEMIHIGDSVKADFLGARKVGIKSILIGRKNRLKRLICS